MGDDDTSRTLLQKITLLSTFIVCFISVLVAVGSGLRFAITLLDGHRFGARLASSGLSLYGFRGQTVHFELEGVPGLGGALGVSNGVYAFLGRS